MKSVTSNICAIDDVYASHKINGPVCSQINLEIRSDVYTNVRLKTSLGGIGRVVDSMLNYEDWADRN